MSGKEQLIKSIVSELEYALDNRDEKGNAWVEVLSDDGTVFIQVRGACGETMGGVLVPDEPIGDIGEVLKAMANVAKEMNDERKEK